MKKHRLLYCFIFILFSMTIADIVKGDITFSELENRKLAKKPAFSVKSLIDGSYGEDYESYINDQFLVRNFWINLKSRSEFVLGKIENNGIIYGKDEYLFEKFSEADSERVERNTDSFEKFFDRYGNKASLMLIPSSYVVYNELLPEGAPVIDQESAINSIYDRIGGNLIYLTDIMQDNKDKYIYYRTDHHWTTLGAYIAYEAYMNMINEQAVLPKVEQNIVEDFYGTYYSKSKPFNVRADALTYYDIDNVEMRIEDKTYDTLYNYEYLDKVDKYSAFLDGNNALTVIKNKNLDNGKKLLLIKDSYGNSIVPFLTGSYEEIHVIDLRSFMIKLSTYIDENNFDNILVLYSYVNFAKDTNIVKMKS